LQAEVKRVFDELAVSVSLARYPQPGLCGAASKHSSNLERQMD